MLYEPRLYEPCVRTNHTTKKQADFRKAKDKVLYKKKEGVPEGLYM